MMAIVTAPEDTEQEKLLPQCGRLVFRGVELAYLKIDGEFMLPLAELLALVLPSTPRTTLFTRMEKMKVRRHFCDPEEIKLLKTVNGIHGSSANCTLLSKTEVDKYCSTYIDKPNEFNQIISGDANAELVAIENSHAENVRKDKERESTHQNNNATPNKLAVLVKHRKSTPLKLSKVTTSKKLKSRYSGDCQVNKTLTDNTSCPAIDGDLTSENVNECGEGLLVSSPSSSHHVTNFTQTLNLVKRGNNKNRVKNRDSSSPANKKKRRVPLGKKRSSNNLDNKEAFESPLKIPKRSEFNGHKENVTVNETNQLRASSGKKHDNVDALISDCSSNDSGFASTALSNTSTPNKSDFSAGELSGSLRKDEDTINEHVQSSPCELNLKTPKKAKTKGSHGKSLTLSPPSLLLKRFEDSWLVEEKSPVNEVTNCLHIKRKVKPRKRARPTGLTPLFEEASVAAEPILEQKQAKKGQKRRKSQNLKEVSSESLIAKNVIVRERQGGAGVKKKKFNRKQKGKVNLKAARKERTLFNGQSVSHEKGNNFSSAKQNKLACLPRPEKTRVKEELVAEKQTLTKEELLKKDMVLERLVESALAKFFVPASPAVSTPSTDFTPAKVAKPKPKKRKVTAITKPVLKSDCNFKLLNWFPTTSLLSLHDGVLTPSFTVTCPKGVEPHSSHPLWNWNLGGPVVRGYQIQKALKPEPVQKKPTSTTKFVANNVQKLKRKRKNPSTSKTPLAVSGDDVVANVTIFADSNPQSVPIASEFKLPLCHTVSNIATSSTGMEVS